MRYIKLILSLLIGFIGTIVYFVTIPTTDGETMIQTTVEAGDESLLDDLYFGGYMMNYSSFMFSQDETIIYEDLPYLEKLDTREQAGITILQKEYPEFINDLIFDVNHYTFGISTNKDFLVAGYFEQEQDSYYADFNQLTVKVLDKASGNVKVETIPRKDAPTGDSVDFLGVYQDYPRVNFLINTVTWDRMNGAETAKISLIEYNVETKNVSENSIKTVDGYIYNQGFGIISTNKQLLPIILSPDYNQLKTYLFNFEDHSLTEIGSESDHFITSEDNRLYSLTNENGQTILNLHDEKTNEVVEQTELELEETIDFTMEYPAVLSKIADGKLSIVLSRLLVTEDSSDDIPPSTLYIFDIDTGEQLLESTFEYDLENQSPTNEVMIELFGSLADF